MFKLLGVYGPFGPRGGMYVSCCINLYCIYHANNDGMYVSWCIHWYCIYSANNWGICISCWVSVGPSGPGGVCMSVAVYIHIDVCQLVSTLDWYWIYSANNWGICVSC